MATSGVVRSAERDLLPAHARRPGHVLRAVPEGAARQRREPGRDELDHVVAAVRRGGRSERDGQVDGDDSVGRDLRRHGPHDGQLGARLERRDVNGDAGLDRDADLARDAFEREAAPLRGRELEAERFAGPERSLVPLAVDGVGERGRCGWRPASIRPAEATRSRACVVSWPGWPRRSRPVAGASGSPRPAATTDSSDVASSDVVETGADSQPDPRPEPFAVVGEQVALDRDRAGVVAERLEAEGQVDAFRDREICPATDVVRARRGPARRAPPGRRSPRSQDRAPSAGSSGSATSASRSASARMLVRGVDRDPGGQPRIEAAVGQEGRRRPSPRRSRRSPSPIG